MTDPVFQTIVNLSPIAIIGILVYILYYLLVVQKGRAGEGDRKLDDLKDNHIHEIKDSLERIERLLQNMNDKLTRVDSRINGPRK